MRRMIADAEDALDHLGDPLGGPDLPTIAKRLRASCQYLWQLGHLLCAQLGLGARCRVTTQRFDSLGPASFEPLADRSFAHSQGHSNVFLLPALLRQLRGSSTTPFFPIFSLLVFLHASILACLASYAGVNRGTFLERMCQVASTRAQHAATASGQTPPDQATHCRTLYHQST